MQSKPSTDYTNSLDGELHMATNSSTALITGGTSGIGRAAANKLAQLGIHVIVVGRNAERDASSARTVARRAVEFGNGHVDILINNAGIFPCLYPTPPPPGMVPSCSEVGGL